MLLVTDALLFRLPSSLAGRGDRRRHGLTHAERAERKRHDVARAASNCPGSWWPTEYVRFGSSVSVRTTFGAL